MQFLYLETWPDSQNRTMDVNICIKRYYYAFLLPSLSVPGLPAASPSK